jgi:hypothetical protein
MITSCNTMIIAQFRTGRNNPCLSPELWAIFPASQGDIIPPHRPMVMTTLNAVPEKAGKLSPTTARVVG